MKKIIIIIFVFLGIHVSSSAQVSVIVNKSVSETSLNAAKVTSIFTLDLSKWNDGSKITVFAQSGQAKDQFYTGIGKSELTLKKEWMKKQLTGKGKAPETLSSDSETIDKVTSTPGAIGFVLSSSVTGDVKVLLEIK